MKEKEIVARIMKKTVSDDELEYLQALAEVGRKHYEEHKDCSDDADDCTCPKFCSDWAAVESKFGKLNQSEFE